MKGIFIYISGKKPKHINLGMKISQTLCFHQKSLKSPLKINLNYIHYQKEHRNNNLVKRYIQKEFHSIGFVNERYSIKKYCK